MPHVPRRLSVSPGTAVPYTTHTLGSLYIFVISKEEGEAGEAIRGKYWNHWLSKCLGIFVFAEAREATAEAKASITRSHHKGACKA
jgi:hypothetical protein